MSRLCVRSRWPRPMVVAMALGMLWGLEAPGTRGSAVEAGEPAAQAAGKVDELLVVDCLLPGQIRRLGRQLTFVAPRRAIKTTGADCEIRGGEYVAYDRASYATALKVWLPLAQQGDPAAQTYVGEIFEKGLGVPSDYAAAAEWYRRAAERGHSRGAINLGNLYERGLGVPKDPQQALNWYRRGAGLGEVGFAVTSPTPVAAEMERLRQEVGELRRQVQAKEAEVKQTQAELERMRQRLEERRSEADAERAGVARMRQELEEWRQKGQAAAGTLQGLERAIAEREARLAAKDREVAALRQELARREQERSAEADAERAGVARMRQELEEWRQKGQAAAGTLQGLERAIAERDGKLAAKDREVAALRQELARQEQEARERRAEMERLRQQAVAAPGARTPTPDAGPAVELIEPDLVAAGDTRDVRVQWAGSRLAMVDSLDRVALVGRVTAPAGLKTLTVNDREEPVDPDRMFKVQFRAGRSGERVRIVAIDRAGRKSALEFLVIDRRGPAGAGQGDRVGLRLVKKGIRFGTYHALVIGNNDYRHRQLRRLKTAVNDAQEVARVLRDEYGFTVKLLLNATRYEILAALNELRQRLTEKDNLLLYYAGHGDLDQVNQRGYWLPVDAEPDSTANWISNIAISDILNVMSVRQLLVVADSCYSGTLTRSAIGQLDPGLSPEKRLELMELMAQKRSRMVMTSGGLEPVLDSVGGAHSAFAQSFIEMLGANVGVLPGQELFQLLRLRVAARAQTMEVSQVPEYAPIKFAGHESGDFFFARLGAN